LAVARLWRFESSSRHQLSWSLSLKAQSASETSGVSARLLSHRERVAAHDGIVALCTGRDQIDRHLADFLDAPQVLARSLGQAGIVAHAQRALRPAGHFFIDRLAFSQFLRAHRQDVATLTVEAIGHPDL